MALSATTLNNNKTIIFAIITCCAHYKKLMKWITTGRRANIYIAVNLHCCLAEVSR